MNTKNLKAYAPKARSQFIEAIKKRAAQFGIYQDKIAEVRFEGGAAIIEGRAFTKKQGDQRKRLEQRVAEKGYDLFIREMAYTWFNRLAAIRYMELHDYLDHGFRVLSNPNNPDSLPEILDHASDVVDILDPNQKYLDKSHIIELQLAGNKEEELYRELLLGQCHRLYNIMPFMFEAIDDATELLLPDNLTKTDSILKGLVNEIPEEDWSEIEVIGWLYQFYISEHKDAVIGKVVKSEDIPAATQLFTPNWIVKYLVQNSLGRQWLATYPESELKGKMEYYIEPAEQSDDVIAKLKAITPTSIDPEQIKVLDPAAGSGHILVEVYEVLREIYLERGYRLREIPELILTKNIYGLDIDDRAAQLAGFALMMKAREDDRRIFQRVEDGEVSLNVYSLQSTEGLDIGKLWQALNLVGNQQQGSTGGLFDGLDDEPESFVQATGIYKEYFELLQTLKSAFLQAKTLGSLIQIDNAHSQNLVALKELLQAKEKGSDPSAKQAVIDILPAINQAILLAQQYDAVVANPPYMGNKLQNKDVKSFLKKHYPEANKDLFSSFILRNIELSKPTGELGFMTPFVWMFISSYQSMREVILSKHTLSSLIQLEYNASGDVRVPLCTFCISKYNFNEFTGSYIRLADFSGDANQPIKVLEAKNNRRCGWLFESKPNDFLQIKGAPIAYWVTNKARECFNLYPPLSENISAKQGLATTDNNQFTRRWSEVALDQVSFNSTSREEALDSCKRWFPMDKGGSYRKWFGNNEVLVDWEKDGLRIKNNINRKYPYLNGNPDFVAKNSSEYFKEGITWGKITSSKFSSRYSMSGAVFSDAGMKVICEGKDALFYQGLLSSKVFSYLLSCLSETLNFEAGNIGRVPVVTVDLEDEWEELIQLAQEDWNSKEQSWDFSSNELVNSTETLLSKSYENLLVEWRKKILRMKELEEINNRNFIGAYGLEGEVTEKVEEVDVTLSCNPAYRYNIRQLNPSHWDRLKAESLAEMVSYSLGVMMGRYSLDREGLVYAHSANEGFKELAVEGVYQTFPADDDGIVPLASEDWLFSDDATARFREFVKTVWGDENLQENLEFVAESLCLHTLKPAKNESANETVRRYFSKQFYKDHCKTYKKRPIYWLFSSGKEKAFECLVYLHRYNEGTLSRMRTEYVTPLMGKYEAQHSLLTEQKLEAITTEARRIEKELKSLEKKQAELRTFDEQLKHYAEMRITLDLDDGVKANYGKFGNLLADVKAIHGKAVK